MTEFEFIVILGILDWINIEIKDIHIFIFNFKYMFDRVDYMFIKCYEKTFIIINCFVPAKGLIRWLQATTTVYFFLNCFHCLT